MMNKEKEEEKLEKLRKIAVKRYFNGESPKEICRSLNRSTTWLLKWADRYDPNDSHWYCAGWIRRRSKEKRTKKKGRS